ncbi:hypothetical protein IKD82_01290 [Candidatus Saccharibacteria bacterium]|nr:hypothetical protein [Candidatus Saccharibacteria bacterium]
MAKISKFPLQTGENGFSKFNGGNFEGATREKSLDTILQLAWDNINAYLSLETACITNKPVEEQHFSTLKDLDLINDKGYPFLNVYSIMKSISKRRQQKLYHVM